MKVQTFSSIGFEHGFSEFNWDIAYVGAGLDQRTLASIELAKTCSKSVVLAEFNIEQPDRLNISGVLKPLIALEAELRNVSSLLLEATSLGTIEILFLLRAAKVAGLSSIDCLYVEPLEYASHVRLNSPWSREYSLSLGSRLDGVRGFSYKLSDLSPADTKFVTFLGYEGSRLAQACEQEDLLVSWKQKIAVFGVPGYAPGWDMNSMANNIDCLSRGRGDFTTIRYCSASSVSNAYDLLTGIHNEGSDRGSHTVVAPFGTKPHGIATAMFLVDQSAYQASSLLYDHPARAKDRSTNVRRWHLYRIFLNE